MLAIHPFSTTKPIKPNILPCSIKHNGPIPTSSRHWGPTSTSSNTETLESSLRGRKLLGKAIPLPANYEGVVLQKTDKKLAAKPQLQAQDKDEDDEDDETEEPVEVKLLEQEGKFIEITVWGHEAIPDEEDAYRKGIEEWIGFAEAMHAYDTPTS